MTGRTRIVDREDVLAAMRLRPGDALHSLDIAHLARGWTDDVRRCLDALESDGLVVRAGRNGNNAQMWRLAPGGADGGRG